MRSPQFLVCLMIASITGTMATACAQPPPPLIPITSPASTVIQPASTVDTPSFKESEVIGIASNQSDVKALYASAETTKDYAYPEVKDFQWTARYLNAGRWFVSLAYTQWDYNLGGYIARTKSWFFDEKNGALTPAG